MKPYKLFFLIFILTLLISPLFYMNTADISEQENRTLAKFPKTRKEGIINSDFSKEFEAWLSDRFGGRDQLIDTRFQTLYKINGRIENEKAFIGDDGWMFKKSDTVNIPSIKKQRQKIEKEAQKLKNFAAKFKDKNIPIYFVTVPSREVLYQKYWEKYYKPKQRLDYGEEITKLLKGSNIRIIYPKKEMLQKADTENLFRKSDGHLSFYGAKLLAESFIKRISSDFNVSTPSYIFDPPKESASSNIASILKISPNPTDTDSDISIKSEDVQATIISVKDRSFRARRKTYSQKAPLKKEIFVLGVCYGRVTLYPFAEILFEKSNFYRLNYKDEWEKVKKDFSNDFKNGSPEKVIVIMDGINALEHIY